MKLAPLTAEQRNAVLDGEEWDPCLGVDIESNRQLSSVDG
jgi:hypothetical protein